MFLKVLYQRNYIHLKSIFTGRRYLTSQKIMNICNFVFMDIETTGLPHEEYNRTRITEICFVVAQSDHISLGVYPRVQNKLRLSLNPQKIITPTATEITRLTNDLLQFQPTFQETTCNVIKEFLELQRKPICLVAHNGNYFDYPILKSELYKVGCELTDDILCIDSLQMFRDLDKTHKIESEEFKSPDCSLSETRKSTTSEKGIEDLPTQLNIYNLPTQKNLPVELCDGFDELLYNIVEDLENSSDNSKKEIKVLNESTPKKSKVTIISNNNSKTDNMLQNQLYYMPSSSKENKANNFKNSNAKSNVATSSTARKKLDFGRQSYKLIDIYTRLTNKKNENAHLAEEDVSMLIECAATLGEVFVDWANVNAKKFADIPMMKPGMKIGL